MKKPIYLALIVLMATVLGAATFAVQQTPVAKSKTAAKPKPKPKAKAKTAAKPKVTPATTKKATEITWFTPTEGYAKAKKEKKILVVDVYTDWCYWCKVMDKQTYTDSNIIDKMNQYFVAVKFNPENNGSHTVNGQVLNSGELLQYLANGGGNSGYPTTYFWKKLEDNTDISGYPGYREAKPFGDILNNWIVK
ncbi:MAG: DUF255 domain-containing protein [Bacteroidota bacterium]